MAARSSSSAASALLVLRRLQQLALKGHLRLALPLVEKPGAGAQYPRYYLLLDKEEQLALIDVVPGQVLTALWEALCRVLGLPLVLLWSVVTGRIRRPVRPVVLERLVVRCLDPCLELLC